MTAWKLHVPTQIMVFGRIAVTPYTSSPSDRPDAVRRIYKRANQKDGLDGKMLWDSHAAYGTPILKLVGREMNAQGLTHQVKSTP